MAIESIPIIDVSAEDTVVLAIDIADMVLVADPDIDISISMVVWWMVIWWTLSYGQSRE